MAVEAEVVGVRRRPCFVKGEDVQIEIPNVGIFPGKNLRTTKQ